MEFRIGAIKFSSETPATVTLASAGHVMPYTTGTSANNTHRMSPPHSRSSSPVSRESTPSSHHAAPPIPSKPDAKSSYQPRSNNDINAIPTPQTLPPSHSSNSSLPLATHNTISSSSHKLPSRPPNLPTPPPPPAPAPTAAEIQSRADEIIARLTSQANIPLPAIEEAKRKETEARAMEVIARLERTAPPLPPPPLYGVRPPAAPPGMMMVMGPGGVLMPIPIGMYGMPQHMMGMGMPMMGRPPMGMPMPFPGPPPPGWMRGSPYPGQDIKVVQTPTPTATITPLPAIPPIPTKSPLPPLTTIIPQPPVPNTRTEASSLPKSKSYVPRAPPSPPPSTSTSNSLHQTHHPLPPPTPPPDTPIPITPPNPSNQIYLGSLPQRTTLQLLKQAFSALSPIKSVELRQPYAMIEFMEKGAAKRAVEVYDGGMFLGGVIRVERAEEDEEEEKITREGAVGNKGGVDVKDKVGKPVDGGARVESEDQKGPKDGQFKEAEEDHTEREIKRFREAEERKARDRSKETEWERSRARERERAKEMEMDLERDKLRERDRQRREDERNRHEPRRKYDNNEYEYRSPPRRQR